jgi:hypothetical protein
MKIDLWPRRQKTLPLPTMPLSLSSLKIFNILGIGKSLKDGWVFNNS